ncbi:MAG: transporter substrate-binding protein [Paenibacillaceae bacterium]|jgi:putative aldouronate transport system substrate-binding protein|nr:transporter substrate-binding protein [Paenibacillaceae bacterium]
MGMKKMQRLLSLVMVLVIALSAAACSKDANETEDSPTAAPTASGDSATQTAGVTFPLAKPVTFTIAGVNGTEGENPEQTAFFKKLAEKTNVNIKFISLGANANGATEKLNVLLGTEDAPDAIMGASAMNETFLALYAKEGYLVPMNQYLKDPKVMPVFNSRILGEKADILNGITSPDGNIYSLPYVNEIPGTYLESPIWINKVWLDNLGLTVPTTLAELENVMEAFATKDANKNGDPTDEIPLLARTGAGYEHLEAWLSLWGIPTKDSTYENFVYVKDGKVIFAPTTEEYKAYIKTMQKWYEKKWLWNEYFTGSSQTFSAIANDAGAAKYGILTAKNPAGKFTDQYVAILPPVAEGYQPKFYLNPAYLSGSKGHFELTSHSKNPEILMAFIDQFYLMENTLEAYNGIANEDPRLTLNNGVYKVNSIPAEEMSKYAKNTFRNYFQNNLPGSVLESDYRNGRVEMSAADKVKGDTYDLYAKAGVINTEVWPRPYLDPGDAAKLNEMRTDIFNTVSKYRASWVTGQSDIDKEWGAYLNSLKSMKVDDLVVIMQKTYDNYMSH